MAIGLLLEVMYKTIKIKNEIKHFSPASLDPRYIIERFHSKSLENNPLNSTPDRDLRVYLPPGYFENPDKRYPVVYFLHCYGLGYSTWMFVGKKEHFNGCFGSSIFPKKLLNQLDSSRLCFFYENIDNLIIDNKLPPFILVQIDGTLMKPLKYPSKSLTNLDLMKGSNYINSDTGNYMDYVVKDIIPHIDSQYRTIANKSHRAVFGHSMGGYGTLMMCMTHPDLFIAAGSLASPVDSLDFYNIPLIHPYMVQLLGEKKAIAEAQKEREDIIESFEMMLLHGKCSPDYLIRDEQGKAIGFKDEYMNDYLNLCILPHLKSKYRAFEDTHLLIYADEADEFNTAEGAKQVHSLLNEKKIFHEYEVTRDPKAWLTPHTIGPEYHIVPTLKFLTQYFK